MKASFSATHPLTTIKSFVTVYSDEHSRKRDRQELRQCGFKAGTATALFQASESTDATKPVAIWTSVVKCKTAAAAVRFARAERQDVNREWTKPPTAAKVRRQPASALPHGALAAVAATKLTGGEKASLTIVLVPRGPNVAVLTLTSQTGFNPYPQARNLMRRMLGLKPIATCEEAGRAGPDRRSGRNRALRARLIPSGVNGPGTVAERAARGRAARAGVPRSSHASYDPPADRRDPVDILEGQAETRAARLVPIRYGRMLASPFAFFRGAAAIMAADLASTPRSGFDVQCCGDAHLANFGLFGSPERRLVFDINDFDETLPGPWEWDVKRLAASLLIAARERGFARRDQDRVVLATAGEYRAQMTRFAAITNLAVWYARVDVDSLDPALSAEADPKTRKQIGKLVTKARTRDSLEALSKLTHVVDGEIRIVSRPPLLVPVSELVEDQRAATLANLQAIMQIYRRSLQANRRVLLESYELADLAHKVVGVGSVGTQAWIALLLGRDHQDPLFLQVKEAQASVLEAHLRKSAHRNAGHRVVAGQRLMQATSDIFLGWLSVKEEQGTAGRATSTCASCATGRARWTSPR